MSLLDYIIRGGEDAYIEENEWKRVSTELHENVQAFKDQYPEYAESVGIFLSALDDVIRRRYRRTRVEGNTRPPQDAIAQFFLSPDRMKAFACILPPADGGADITTDSFLSDLRYQGVSYGLLEDRIRAFSREKPYLQIVLIAEGTAPCDGKEGHIEELFEPKIETALEVDPEERIDFTATDLVRTVHAGAPILNIIPAVSGRDGIDVTGMAVPCRQAEEIQVPIGQNTKLTADGRSVVAAIDGILYVSGFFGELAEYAVRPQRLFAGDLDTFSGILRIGGNLYIPGNVFGGVQIEAGGDIIIAGDVGDAHIVSAAGTIRVQKGIHGVEGKTMVRAHNQVQARFIEMAHVEAGGDIIAEAIVDSEVVSGGVVAALGGHGMILGGHIYAAKRVCCQRIGNLTEKRTEITVGFSRENAAEQERIEKGLAETRNMLEMLWGHISSLRKLGNQVTNEQEILLDRLVEQRALYEQQDKQLKADWKELTKSLKAASQGSVTCDQLFPVTGIQIGMHRQEYTAQTANCRIHLYGDRLLSH